VIPVLVDQIWGLDRTLLQDSFDSRLADVHAGPGQFLGDLQFAERRAEELELLDGVTHDVRKPIDRG
jgi:hypothetical protein